MTTDIDFATLDPAADPRFPRISTGPPVEVEWPETWGAEPTHRDAFALTLDELDAAGYLNVPRVRGAAPNLRDYRSAAVKGWGAGWPSCDGAKRFGTVIVTADRSGVRWSVNRRIAVLWDTLIDRMEARGYLCKNGQCGAYNCRPIGGTQTSSNHAWALAGDINWQDNPYTTTGRYSMPLWVPREIFNPYGFAWGGDYSGARKDYMHVEFMGTPTQADEMTRKALGAVTPAVRPAGRRILRYVPGEPIMSGPDVAEVQRVLRAWYGLPESFVDEDYGPTTVTYVKRAQAGTPPTPALAADGEVGPNTRRKLGLPA